MDSDEHMLVIFAYNQFDIGFIWTVVNSCYSDLGSTSSHKISFAAGSLPGRYAFSLLSD